MPDWNNSAVILQHQIHHHTEIICLDYIAIQKLARRQLFDIVCNLIND